MIEASVVLTSMAVVLASWLASLRDRDLRPLAEELGGELIKGALHGEHQGTGYRVRIVKGENARAIVSIVCPSAGHLRITRRRWYDRLFEPLFPHQELSYGDPRFHERYVVQTRDLTLGRELLSRPEARAAIGELFTAGACVVHVDGDRIKATTNPRRLGKPVTHDRVLAFVEPLSHVGEAVADVAHRGPPLAPRRDRLVVTSWAVLITSAVVGLVTTVVGLEVYGPVDAMPLVWFGLGLGLTATALTAVILVPLLSSRTAPGRTVMPMLILAVLTQPFAALGLASSGNGLLDDAPPTPIAGLTPTSFRLVKSDDGYVTRAQVGAPVPGDPEAPPLTLDLKLSPHARDDLAAGARIWVDVRPGAFGQPWLAAYGLGPVHAPGG